MQNPQAPPAVLALIEYTILGGTAIIALAWIGGTPILYADSSPVMSFFTAFSLALLTISRLAARRLRAWPLPLSLALMVLVIGGNLSSVLMQTMPPEMLKTFPDIVLTSIMTSIGLIIFSLYEMLVALRDTPRQGFILDDILLHLALVPGGISLLGILLNNPGYLSVGDDPRIGISPLEMLFMGAFAVSAVLSNSNLFLWQFLAKNWPNRLIFGGLFINQFVAPLIVAWIFRAPDATGLGLELFVMLGGVLATLTFLVVQAWTRDGTGPEPAAQAG